MLISAIDITESTLLLALLFFLIVLLGCAVGHLREQWRVYSTLRRLRAFDALADHSRYALRHTVRMVTDERERDFQRMLTGKQ